MMDTTDDIGRMLRELRGARTQTQAAALCGVPQSTWSAWERRASAPSAERLGAVLDALGATVVQREAIGRALVGLAVVRR